MAKKRYIDTSFWSDVWVVDELNPLDRYLFLYFLTNEKTNISGVYELSLRTIAYETGLEKEEIMRMLKRLESRVIYHSGWVVLRNAIKNQSYKHPKIKQGIENALIICPKVLLQYINCPNDWIPPVVKMETGNLQMEFGSLPIGNVSQSHSNSNSNLYLNPNASTHNNFLKKEKVATKNSPAYKQFKNKRKALGL